MAGRQARQPPNARQAALTHPHVHLAAEGGQELRDVGRALGAVGVRAVLVYAVRGRAGRGRGGGSEGRRAGRRDGSAGRARPRHPLHPPYPAPPTLPPSPPAPPTRHLAHLLEGAFAQQHLARPRLVQRTHGQHEGGRHRLHHALGAAGRWRGTGVWVGVGGACLPGVDPAAPPAPRRMPPQAMLECRHGSREAHRSKMRMCAAAAPWRSPPARYLWHGAAGHRQAVLGRADEQHAAHINCTAAAAAAQQERRTGHACPALTCCRGAGPWASPPAAVWPTRSSTAARSG